MIIYSYTSPQHVVICWVCISLAGSREDSRALCVPKAFGVGGSGRRTEGRGEREGMWRGGDAGATLSHERGSFDLIIWEGQSAFVDEESL